MNDDFINVKILEMKCDCLLKELEEYDVVVVIGF